MRSMTVCAREQRRRRPWSRVNGAPTRSCPVWCAARSSTRNCTAATTVCWSLPTRRLRCIRGFRCSYPTGISLSMPSRFGRRDVKPGNDRGFVAIEWVAAVAMLLLPAVVLVGALPTWAERRHAATVAARGAAGDLQLQWPAGDEGEAERGAKYGGAN